MPIKVAGLQTAGTPGDVGANLEELAQAAAEARGSGADLLITPEMFVTGYNIGDRVHELATAELLKPAQDIAARLGIALLLGAPERTGEGTYNSVFFIDDAGHVVARYRKSHLFGDVDRQRFLAGDEPFGLVEFRGVRIAMLICYDIEFPEVARVASLQGAHLIAVPTAQMEPFALVAESLIRHAVMTSTPGSRRRTSSSRSAMTSGPGGSRCRGRPPRAPASCRSLHGQAVATLDRPHEVGAHGRAQPGDGGLDGVLARRMPPRELAEQVRASEDPPALARESMQDGIRGRGQTHRGAVERHVCSVQHELSAADVDPDPCRRAGSWTTISRASAPSLDRAGWITGIPNCPKASAVTGPTHAAMTWLRNASRSSCLRPAAAATSKRTLTAGAAVKTTASRSRSATRSTSRNSGAWSAVGRVR